MSSPLSMLKKTKRAPLQGPTRRDGENVPLRRNLLSDVKDTSQIEDSTSSQSSVSLISSTSRISQKKVTQPSDMEFMSAMTQRLTLLETKLKNQAQELEQKDIKISVLEEKLRHLKKTENGRDHSDSDDLFMRCFKLQTQVHEMECFLNDYGLIWVGDGVTADMSNKPETAEVTQPKWPKRESQNRGGKFHMNFDLVLQNIKMLNILAGDGESFVQPTATGAHLAKKKPIQLRLYSNGIVLFDGPFRSYQEHQTQQCMHDLMDGYFPSELQQRFPDGVPFEVQDKRDEEFIDSHRAAKFPGLGQAVRGAPTDEWPGRKLSMEQFLQRLPKVVIKAGRVIDIREPVKVMLQDSSALNSKSVSIIDTPALQALKKRQHNDFITSLSDREVTTLKVKSEDGDHSYILKMCLSETIGHLRQYLDKHRGGKSFPYDIITMHPMHSYDNNNLTLLSCGLTTNCTLLLRRSSINLSTEQKS